MPIITTGAHPKALWPGVRKWFGAVYDKQPKRWSQIYETVNSSRAYEEDVAMTSFGLASKKPEGQPITYDSHAQEWTRRHTHDTYALGYIVTEEEIDDNLYEDKSFNRSQLLALSMAETKEINGAALLVNAFDAAYTGGDGVALCATTHPTGAGNQANTLSAAADFSEAALEDLIIVLQDNKNSRGIRFPLECKKLIISHLLQFDVERVLKSALRPNSVTNDVNVMQGLFSDNAVVVNPYLGGTNDDWFTTTSAPNGLTHFQRRGLKFQQDNDFDTSNAKAKASERYVFDWTDWRGVFGVQGA